ncbi:MAG TPA: DUF1345 domain-containing protein [Ilumatobacteraceae bacterium]|nr:DUF1345 domain-containing protein [Ilumatobacteraceae bacterium]
MISSTPRLLICAAAGVVAAVICALVAPWQFAVLGGWVLAGALFVSMVWFSVRPMPPSEVQHVATREDSGRMISGTVTVIASVVSLAGVVLGIIKAEQSAQPWKALLIIFAVAAVVVSWLSVHTVYALRYAHLYYMGPDGGIDFPGGEPPDYQDFGYLSFCLGMTFQISDTNVTSKTIRRLVTQHTLISYVFATFIVGLTINVMAGFIR